MRNNLTLDQALEEIRKSDKPVSEKKEMCIKLGIRRQDVEILEFTGFFNTKTPLTFGVEIECNVFRNRIYDATNDRFHFFYEGYNHTDHRDYFKFVTDGSVTGDSPIECVTPILDDNTDGFSQLENCCKVLNDAGAYVNRSCGLHVHVGVSTFKGEQIVNIYKNYQKLESLIDKFMAPSRRGNDCRWGKSIQGYDFSRCHSADDLKNLLHNDRYHKVNPMAFYRHQTVEFRQHQGSVSYEKISMWVRFCCKLVEWSKDHVLDSTITNVYDIPFLNTDEKEFFSGRVRFFSNAA